MHILFGALVAIFFWIFRWFDLPLWLVGLLMLPLAFMKGKFFWGKYISVAAVFLGLFSLLFTSEFFVKLYPVAVNLILFAVFSYSLYKPPTVIEQFARLKDPNLPNSAINYIKKVTVAWIVFFLSNGAIALYTSLLDDDRYWLIYTGFISYVLIGIFFSAEYLIRMSLRKKHG